MSVSKFYVENRNIRGFDQLLSAVETCEDVRQGVLLDSSLGYIGDLAIVVLDTYETSNSSGYTVYLAGTSADNAEVEKVWYDFCEDYDSLYGEDAE